MDPSEISLIERLYGLKRSLELADLLAEHGDQGSAVMLANWIIRQMAGILDVMRRSNNESRAYVDVIIKNKAPEFDSDRSWFETSAAEFDRTGMIDPVDNLSSKLKRLHQYYDFLVFIGGHLYSISSPFRLKLKKYRKPMIVVATIVVSLIVINSGIKIFLKRGHGLIGEYYADMGLSNLHKVKTDYSINFDWGGAPPFKGFNDDQFSIRWSGYVYTPKAGEYEFFTLSDDGVRLWINNKLVINNWTRHWPEMDQASVELDEGYHEIRLEYFENSRSATIKLFWKPDAQSDRQIIGPKNLFVSPN